MDPCDLSLTVPSPRPASTAEVGLRVPEIGSALVSPAVQPFPLVCFTSVPPADARTSESTYVDSTSNRTYIYIYIYIVLMVQSIALWCRPWGRCSCQREVPHSFRAPRPDPSTHKTRQFHFQTYLTLNPVGFLTVFIDRFSIGVHMFSIGFHIGFLLGWARMRA